MSDLKKMKTLVIALCICIMSSILMPIRVNAELTTTPTSPTISGTTNGVIVANSSIVNTNVTVSIGGSQSSDGIKQYDYYVNKNGVDGQWQVYTGPFTISDEGSYTIFATATSNSGIKDRLVTFVNYSFIIIKSSPILNSNNTSNSVNLNWTTPNINQSYSYNLYRRGLSTDYIEGTNIVPIEDNQLTNGVLTTNWKSGWIGYTNSINVLNDGTKNYLQVLKAPSTGEGCASLLVSGLTINTMYRLEIDYNYPNDGSLVTGRNFGIVNKADSVDIYNITLPSMFSKTNGWKHLTYDFDSKNNTAVKVRSYIGTSQEIDIANVTVKTLYPKVLATTNQNSFTDTSAVDISAPNPVNSFQTVKNDNTNEIISFVIPSDNGKEYSYYVEAVGILDTIKRSSNVVSSIVTSGINGYYYLIDTNSSNYDFNTTTANVKFTQSNAVSHSIKPERYYLHIKSVDNAGNLSTSTTYTIPDYVSPTLTLSQTPTSWTNQSVTITASASDTGSGLKSITLPNGNLVTNSPVSYVVSSNGTYTFTATDIEGNIITKSIDISNIDTLGGSITLNTSTTSWTNQDVLITANGADSQSGVASITLPNGVVVNGNSATYSAVSNGTYNFTLTDNVGNITSKSIVISNIDKVLPILNLSINTNLFVNTNVIITAIGSDNSSGIKRIKLPDGTWVNGATATYSVSNNGNYTFMVEDNAGNPISSSINISNIIQINPLSGIDRVEYKLSGATKQDWTTYSGIFNVVNEGITTVTARAFDKAGNVSNEATSYVRMDRSKPINGTVEIVIK